MPDDLEGLSQEQLLAKARELQEQVDQQAARKLYGDGNGAIGGGTPGGGGRARNSDDDASFVADFARRFNSKTGRHAAVEPVTKAEVEKYVRIITGAHLTQQLAESSQSFRRAGISPDVVRQARERR